MTMNGIVLSFGIFALGTLVIAAILTLLPLFR